MMVDLLVVAPQRGFSHHVPAGFIFADEVFEAARLQDSISTAQKFSAELERALSYLVQRYPRRIRVSWVSPWSLAGLWLVLRYRLRSFPALIVNRREVLSGEALQLVNLETYVEQWLARAM